MAAGRMAVAAAVAVALLLVVGGADADCFDYCFKNCVGNDKAMADYCNYACDKTCAPDALTQRRPQAAAAAAAVAGLPIRCQIACVRASCRNLPTPTKPGDRTGLWACYRRCYDSCKTKTLPRNLRAGAAGYKTAALPDHPFHKERDDVQPTAVPDHPIYKTAALPDHPLYKTAALPDHPLYKTTAALPDHPIYKTAALPDHPLYKTAALPDHPLDKTAALPDHPLYKTAALPDHPLYKTAALPDHPFDKKQDAVRPASGPDHQFYKTAALPDHPSYKTAALPDHPFHKKGDTVLPIAAPSVPESSLKGKHDSDWPASKPERGGAAKASEPDPYNDGAVLPGSEADKDVTVLP